MSCGAFTEIQYLFKSIIPKDISGYKILDVGCGVGFFGYALRAFRDGEFNITGVDINLDRIKKCHKMNLYNQLYNTDILNWVSHDEYDLIIVSHLVEHLSKIDGIKLISKLRWFTRNILIVTAPYGDTRAELDEGDYPDDEHISIWESKDLIDLGFKTRHMRFSHRAGRIVSIFERIWFRLRGIKRGGVLVGWYKCE